MGEKVHAAPVTKKAPTPPRWSPYGLCQEVDKPKTPAKEGALETYDVAVLIVMPTPHPRVADHRDELGEYTIGTRKFVANTGLDDSMHYEPLRSISIS